MTALTRSEAWRIAWTRGGRVLERCLMYPIQLATYDKFRASKSRAFVVHWSRQCGKSFGAVSHAMASCVERPGFVYKYAAPTQSEARSIVYPHAQHILETCPEKLRPRVYKQDMIWEWRNGSTLKLAGLDGPNMNRLRGTSTHEALVDEGAFVANLEEVVESVLMPQTLTTNGRVIITSTSPTTPAHAFAARYVPDAIAADAIDRRTIYEMPHVPKEVADEYVARAGGVTGTKARREYLAEIVIDETMAVIPEFAHVRGDVVRVVEPPRWRDWYVVSDFGFSDLSFTLFAWYDFNDDVIVIEDEHVAHRTSGLDVGAGIKSKEAALGIVKPARYADAPLQLLADLAHETMGPGIPFAMVPKEDSDAALNNLRTTIQRKRVAIHPRCKSLIYHLENAVWATSDKKTFARVDGCGHFDGVDAMKYLCRVVSRRKNPAPRVDPSLRHIDILGADMPRVRSGWDAGPNRKAGWT